MKLIFLLAFIPDIEKVDRYHIIELFGGQARICRLGKASGARVCSLDRTYCDGDNKKKTNAMDMNTDAGFVLLV